jgi:hypothetical protein
MITILSLVLAASTAAQDDSLRVKNFRSGLACARSTLVEGSSGWICQPTELVLVTDQGSCVFNKLEKLCTWVGFDFDYVAPAPKTKIQCEANSSTPSDEGNPEGIREENATTSKYELELPEKSGHFFNPQFWVFNLHAPGDGDTTSETVCRYQGRELFRSRFRLHFPVEPKEDANAALWPNRSFEVTPLRGAPQFSS